MPVIVMLSHKLSNAEQSKAVIHGVVSAAYGVPFTDRDAEELPPEIRENYEAIVQLYAKLADDLAEKLETDLPPDVPDRKAAIHRFVWSRLLPSIADDVSSAVGASRKEAPEDFQA